MNTGKGYKVLRSGGSWTALKPMGWQWIASWTICTGGVWLLFHLVMHLLHRVPIGWEPVDRDDMWVGSEAEALDLIHDHKRQSRIAPFATYDVKHSVWEDII